MQDIVKPEFTVDANGMMAVPTQPGIGARVLMDRLDKVTVRKEEFKA